MKLYKSGATSIKRQRRHDLDRNAVGSDGVRRPRRRDLALTAATTTPAAGDADNLTITARDVYGNIATAYTGSKSLTFSGAATSPGANKPTVANSSRHRDRLRHRHHDQLHRRRGHGHLVQKRR